MVTLFSMLPDADALLALEPEELAGLLLVHLKSIAKVSSGNFNRHNVSLAGNTYNEYPASRHGEIGKAIMEAWVWLEREGLIAPRPEDTGVWYFVTRRGERIEDPQALQAYRRASVLPKQFLHPVLAQKCLSMFLRGEYDTAVFQAFKEVEVGIRAASRMKTEDYGVPMARKAFDPNTGPLTDKAAPIAEREGLSALMAGAIGSYKNPHSHRNVTLEAVEAAEMLVMASHLLKIVDERAVLDQRGAVSVS